MLSCVQVVVKNVSQRFCRQGTEPGPLHLLGSALLQVTSQPHITSPYVTLGSIAFHLKHHEGIDVSILLLFWWSAISNVLSVCVCSPLLFQTHKKVFCCCLYGFVKLQSLLMFIFSFCPEPFAELVRTSVFLHGFVVFTVPD